MFSVVIPLFNKAPYLQRALDSVYAQSCPADEVIIVNDGSTDGGDLIAKAQRDPRVRVIDQPNQGVSVARNAGIAAASQQYVAFLDADDEWCPGFLAQIKEMIGRFPDAGLYGTGFASVAEGRELRRYGVSHRVFQHGDTETREKGNERPAFGSVDFFKEWQRGHVVHTSSMVVPRRVALAVGFPVGVALCEDYEFLARVALRHPVILASDVLVRHDVSVPGQAAEYWRKGYKKNFEILPYHRFLAEELKKRVFNAEAQRRRGEREELFSRSFEGYCKKEFAKCLLQRLYWGRFDAASEFYFGLGLNKMRLGGLMMMCGWVADHPSMHGGVKMAMRFVGRIRERV